MSSTTNVQNLITNVFRPVYVYDTVSNVFTPRLEISNVDTYIGNEAALTRVQVVDGSSTYNVYVGTGSGNAYTNPQSCAYVTAVGYLAGQGISNVSNSVFIGANTGKLSNATANVLVGYNINTTGSSNVIVGTGPSSFVGSNNILIGNGTSSFPSNATNNILIGNGITNTKTSNTLQIGKTIYGDLSANWVGIGTSNKTLIGSSEYTSFDVSGDVYMGRKVGIQMSPSNSLNVAGSTQSTSGFFSYAGSNLLLLPQGETSIFPITPGTFIVNVQDVTFPSPIYFYGRVLAFDTTGTIPPSVIQDAASGPVSVIILNNKYIGVSNSDVATPHTLSWSITTFPLMP